ncbi:MAG TPA: ATP-grasp domain-containing protein [Pseudonocardiaceae bacterium]|jgi:hypothetical protein
MESFGAAVHCAARSVIGVGPRSTDLLPLARLGLLSNSLSFEGHPWSPALADPPEVWTLEAGQARRRNRWRPADLAEVTRVMRNVASAAERAGRPVAVLAYSPSRQHEAALADCSPLVRLAANSRDILDDLHDKILTRDALRELGVPVPASFAVHRSAPNTADAIRAFGLPFVAQTRSGFGGRGTYLIRSAAELDAALADKPAVDQWLLSAYAGDLTVNFAAVVDGRGQVRVAPPAVQLGDMGAANAFGNYGGNDFAAARDLEPEILRLGEHWTARIGSWLAGKGFLGMFGVDYVIAAGTISAIEVNPRMQASTALLGEIELARGVLPTAVRHLLAFLPGPDPVGCADPVPGEVSGAQLALREHGGAQIVVRAPRPGRYAVVDGDIVFLGPGDGLLDCGDGEIVVVGVPAPGTQLANGATLARVITHDRLADSTGKRLPAARLLTDAVRAAFTFQPVRNQGDFQQWRSTPCSIDTVRPIGPRWLR